MESHLDLLYIWAAAKYRYCPFWARLYQPQLIFFWIASQVCLTKPLQVDPRFHQGDKISTCLNNFSFSMTKCQGQGKL